MVLRREHIAIREEYRRRTLFHGNIPPRNSRCPDDAWGALLCEHRDMKGKWMPVPAAGFGQPNDAFSFAVVFFRTN